MCHNYFYLSIDDNNVYSYSIIFFLSLSVKIIYKSLIVKSLTTIEFREKMSNNYDVSPYA